MRTISSVLVLVGALAAVASPVFAHGTSARRKPCTTSGATWKWRAASGHEYSVYPSDTTCSYARAWATRLTYKPLLGQGHVHPIAGGPKGWTCQMRFPFPFKRAWAGSCTNGIGTFAWLPKVPKAAIGP